MGLTSTSHSGVRVFSGDEEGIHYFLPAGLFIQPPEASVDATKISVASVEATMVAMGGADPTHAMAELALENKDLREALAAERATGEFLHRLLADKIQALIVAEDRIETRGRIIEAKDTELRKLKGRMSEMMAEIEEKDASIATLRHPAAEMENCSPGEDTPPRAHSTDREAAQARKENLLGVGVTQWMFGEAAESELSQALAHAAFTLENPFTAQPGSPRSGPHTPQLDGPASGPCTPAPRGLPLAHSGNWFMRFPPDMAPKGSGGRRSPAVPPPWSGESTGSSPWGSDVADRG